MRVLLVGENNPLSRDPRYALYDEPQGCSGHRLRTMILGLSRRTYFSDAITRMNLVVGQWSLAAARMVAEELRWRPTHDVVVMLGRRVIEAFKFDIDAFTSTGETPVYVALPHPSGLNRIWNDPRAFLAAREVLKKVAPLVPWGEE